MHRSTLPRGARALLVALVSSAALTVSAGAQSIQQAADAVPASVTFAAPVSFSAPAAARPSGAQAPRSMMLESNAVGLTLAARDSVSTKAPAPLPRQESGATRTNTALMIVGAAAIVLGAAVGDEAGTVLIIGGAGVGLYGLYRLLN
ncbi:MAG: hypothetical protein V4617_12790 [Gemmatimonadota bacterium]